MPKSKRRGKKTPKKSSRRTNRQTGSSPGTSMTGVMNRSFIRTQATMPRNCQMFPDILYTQGRTVIDSAPGGSTPQYLTFKANGTMYQFGPQSNFTGAFSGNVPSGSSNLLSSGNGPYDTCWTLDTLVEAQIMTSNTGPSLFVILPSIYTGTPISSLTATQAAEQRGAASVMMSANISTPMKVSLRFHPAEILGITRSVYENSPPVGQFVGADPASLVYFHVIMYPLFGVSTSLSVNLVITSRFKMSALTTLSVTVPS